jgi:hypothetical protein
MPLQFEFNDAPRRHSFKCMVASVRCTSVSAKTGVQCRNRSVIGSPICWQHLRTGYHLRVKTSTIAGAGKGLFVESPRPVAVRAVIFKAGDRIVQYYGDNVTNQTLNARYGDKTAPYGITISAASDVYGDGACRRGVGTLVNRPARGGAPNCRLSSVNRHGQHYAQIIATKPIRNGDELFASYGADYRMNEPGVTYKTVQRRPPARQPYIV